MKSEFIKRGLKAEVDNFGNVIAYKSVSKNPLIVGAHIDEVGLMVKHIDKNGFIRFIKIGTIDDRTLLNQHVAIKTKKGFIPGVIGNKPFYIMEDDEKRHIIEPTNLFIDAGGDNEKQVRGMGIEIGNTITFTADFTKLGQNKISGKAFDDRIGCYILLQMAENIPDNVILLGSAQEEVSTFGKGAMVASYKIDPRAFIAVDSTVAGDHPEVKPQEAPVSLGKGPVIVIVEASAKGNVADSKLTRQIIDCAKEAKIEFQMEAIEVRMTDAASVHNLKGGIPSIALCVPTRYMHSTVGVANTDDIEKCIALLNRVIQK